MLELWHNTETDEYLLLEDGVTEKLSERAGRFFSAVAEANVKLEEENRQLRDYISTFRRFEQ